MDSSGTRKISDKCCRENQNTYFVFNILSQRSVVDETTW
jgi:hypothetical protein